MIKLTKSAKPQILITNEQAWTTEYTTLLGANADIPKTLLGRYKHPDIKNQLIVDNGGKCSYCESKVLHISYGDVEHILPKSRRPELIFDWDNLTLACSICNTNKLDYYNPGNDLLNPYIDEPTEHLMTLGASIFPISLSPRGALTHDTLELNRMALVERREEKLKNLKLLIHCWENETDQVKKSTWEDQIKKELEIDKEYILVSKNYVNEKCNF